MIAFLKKRNKYLMYALLSVVVTVCLLQELIMTVGMFAYTMKTSYGVLLGITIVGTLGALFFLPKLIIFLAYRINTAIFVRESGLLYPFPIKYKDYEATALAFAFPCYFVEACLSLPAFFLPTFTDVLSAVTTLVTYAFLSCHVAYFLKNNSHEYDKRALAVSLCVVPVILIGFRVLIALVNGLMPLWR